MATMTGPWNKVDKILARLDTQMITIGIGKALEKVLLFYKTEMQENIKAGGARVGSVFEPNSPVTIAIKGSSAPLIDKGDLVNGINYVLEGITGFIGLKRGDIHDSSGKALIDIGEVHEFGITLTTSTGGTIVIPARPFIGPILMSSELLEKAKNIFSNSLEKWVFSV